MRKEKEKKIDGTLLVTVWILLGLGLVILYSASAYNGRVRFHDPAYYFKKQLFASSLGVKMRHSTPPCAAISSSTLGRV